MKNPLRARKSYLSGFFAKGKAALALSGRPLRGLALLVAVQGVTFLAEGCRTSHPCQAKTAQTYDGPIDEQAKRFVADYRKGEYDFVNGIVEREARELYGKGTNPTSAVGRAFPPIFGEKIAFHGVFRAGNAAETSIVVTNKLSKILDS